MDDSAAAAPGSAISFRKPRAAPPSVLPILLKISPIDFFLLTPSLTWVPTFLNNSTVFGCSLSTFSILSFPSATRSFTLPNPPSTFSMTVSFLLPESTLTSFCEILICLTNCVFPVSHFRSICPVSWSLSVHPNLNIMCVLQYNGCFSDLWGFMPSHYIKELDH